MASHSDITGIIDTDSRFVIDIVTGKIENHSDKESLRQYSHNSERFSFEMPRHVEGHDMTNCTKVTVNYLAADIPGEYEVDDLAVDSEADDKITFSWLISSNVTQKKGKLRFAVVFECAKEDGTITYRWPTDINYDYEIKETISNDTGIVYENVDILEQWKQQLFYGSNSVTANIQAEGRRQQALVANKGSEVKKSIPDDYATLSDRVSELCDHMDLNVTTYTFSWIGSKKVSTTDGKLFDPGIYAAPFLKPCYSNFVTIGDGIDHLEIHRSANDNKATGGAFYSAASESYFISGFKEDSGNNISVPDGAKYFRINSTTDGSSNLALVVNGIPKETAVEVLKKSIEDIKADAEETDVEIRGLKEDLSNIISPNLFNPAVAKENVAIDQYSGTEMSFDGWIATGYIPVSQNDVLYFSANNEPMPYSTGAFYDAQKKFISGFGNPNNNNNIAVTSDGYARFSFVTVPVNLQIEKGSRTAYIPYGEPKIKADVDNVKKDTDNIKAEVSEVKAETVKIQEDHSNLFNKDTVVKGAILAENGIFEPGFSTWDTSDYIPVKPGMTLYFSSNQLPIGVVSTGAYFDKDKKYVSGVNNEPTVLTVPDGAYYLRFSKNSGLGDTLNTLKIEQHGITKFTPYGELYITVNESALPSSMFPKWKGLKILTLGDSITAMGGVNGWTYWIKQYLLADKVVNVSVAGSTWQDKVANQTYDGNPQPSTDGNVMGNQVQKVLNAKANGDADYQDFDVITFSFGTNDSVDFSVQTKGSVEKQFITNYAQNNFTVVPIDNVNRQTLAGAMRYGFQKLHEAYPNAVIFMCTPTQECYETFDSIYQKGDFINFIADRCGAETIDTRRCGIRNIYESQTTIDYDHPDQSGEAPIQTDLLDGIHTNENGAKKIAKYNAREIMKYFMIS